MIKSNINCNNFVIPKSYFNWFRILQFFLFLKSLVLCLIWKNVSLRNFFFFLHFTQYKKWEQLKNELLLKWLWQMNCRIWMKEWAIGREDYRINMMNFMTSVYGSIHMSVYSTKYQFLGKIWVELSLEI